MAETIHERVEKLTKSAAKRYGIEPEQCHVGHLMLEGLLEKPMEISQIDAATDTREANISFALRSMRLASAMKNFGLKPGDQVVIIARGHLDMCVAFYACHYMGYSMCSIDPAVEPEELTNLFSILEPKVMFTIKLSEEKDRNAIKANNLNTSVFVFDDPSNDLEVFVQKYEGTVIHFRPAQDFDTAETPAWLILTSGTTGPPKAAITPYDNVLHCAIQWWDGEYFDLDVFDVSSNMILASTQWLTSLVFTMSSSIKSYTRIQSSEQMNPRLLVHMINTYKPHVTAWTPFLLARFVQGPKGVCDLSCFRHILVGGSAAETHIVDEFRKICPARLYLCFGMSELLVPIFKYADETTPVKSCGQAIPNKYKYRLIAENGEDVTEPNTKGELWVKGKFFKGYLGYPEETKEVLNEDGWLMTGDIFYRDENHYYYYVERKRLLIRYLTFLVSPLEIEAVIKRHPGVLEACVVGIPEPTIMEAATAVIMKKPGVEVNPQEIFDLVKNNLPVKKQLYGGLFFVDSFPTTVSSKINRSKVLAMAKTAERIMPR